MDDGANILYTTSLASGPAQLATTVDSMGIRDQVVLAGPSWVIDSSVVALGGESVNGIIGQLPFKWWDEIEEPGVQLVTSYWAEHRLATAQNPNDAFLLRNIAYLLAWGTVDLYRQMLTAAINVVGPDALDGQAVYDVLTSGTEFAPLGGIITLQYDETVRAPHQTRIAQIDISSSDIGMQAQVIPLTEWIEAPDLIPGGADVVE
jgi:hypothetical protein